MKKDVVGGVPGSVLGMLGDLCLKLQHGARTPEQFDRFLKGENPFETGQDWLSDWQDFYKDLGIQVDFSNLQIPERKRGLDRLLVMAQGITPQRAYDKSKELFPCWKWTDDSLNEVVQSERTAKEAPYAVWVRDRVEADEELQNFSAEDLKRKGIPGITLDERFIYELVFHKETGNHLDIRNLTLCAASRYSGGHVPYVRWAPGGRGLYVGWCSPRFANPHLRGRAVVSL